MKSLRLPLLPTIVSAMVVIAVIVGLLLSGSPSNERLHRFDLERVSDLQTIKDVAVENFFAENNRLPDSMDELMKGSNLSMNSFQDPETKEIYTYQRISQTEYQLCATFGLPSKEEPDLAIPLWTHNVGLACFTLKPSIKANPSIIPGTIPVKPVTP